MKVVIIGSSGKDSFEENLIEAINSFKHMQARLLVWPPKVKSIGPKVIIKIINYLLRKSIPRKILNKRFLARIEKTSPDLVIVCTGAARLLPPKIVAKIRGKGIVVFCWYVDASINFTEDLLYSEYDHMYFIDKGLLDYIKPILRTKKSSLLLEGHNPFHHKANSFPTINDKIAVVGSIYPERVLLLEYLANLGFELEIYGFGLPKGYGEGILRKFDMKKYLTLEEKSRVFQNSRCVLNSFAPSHINAINCRVFEALASGALLVTQSSDLLRDTFVDSKELIIYDSFDDLPQIFNSIFNDEINEKVIRENAISIASKHSLTRRVETIIRDFTETK